MFHVEFPSDSYSMEVPRQCAILEDRVQIPGGCLERFPIVRNELSWKTSSGNKSLEAANEGECRLIWYNIQMNCSSYIAGKQRDLDLSGGGSERCTNQQRAGKINTSEAEGRNFLYSALRERWWFRRLEG